MSQTPIKVAIVGANGTLGPYILSALSKSNTPTFNITVLNRASSKSIYPSNITIATIPDDLEHSGLVTALTGQDVFIIAVSGHLTSISFKLIAAASEAGVSRIIPADFGSCDSSDPHTLALIPLYPDKKRIREYLMDLSAKSNGKLSWTSIVCGHFLDYGLKGGMMQIDFAKRRARRFDGGEKPFSCSVLRTVGDAVVGVLRKPDETGNRMVYVQSVRTTQNELLSTVERLVGGERFEVEDWDSEAFIKEWQRKLEVNPKDHEATEDLVGVEGIINADWVEKEDFVNGLFGLPEENIEDIVKECLEYRK